MLMGCAACAAFAHAHSTTAPTHCPPFFRPFCSRAASVYSDATIHSAIAPRSRPSTQSTGPSLLLRRQLPQPQLQVLLQPQRPPAPWGAITPAAYRPAQYGITEIWADQRNSVELQPAYPSRQYTREDRTSAGGMSERPSGAGSVFSPRSVTPSHPGGLADPTSHFQSVSMRLNSQGEMAAPRSLAARRHVGSSGGGAEPAPKSFAAARRHGKEAGRPGDGGEVHSWAARKRAESARRSTSAPPGRSIAAAARAVTAAQRIRGAPGPPVPEPRSFAAQRRAASAPPRGLWAGLLGTGLSYAAQQRAEAARAGQPAARSYTASQRQGPSGGGGPEGPRSYAAERRSSRSRSSSPGSPGKPHLHWGMWGRSGSGHEGGRPNASERRSRSPPSGGRDRRARQNEGRSFLSGFSGRRTSRSASPRGTRSPTTSPGRSRRSRHNEGWSFFSGLSGRRTSRSASPRDTRPPTASPRRDHGSRHKDWSFFGGFSGKRPSRSRSTSPPTTGSPPRSWSAERRVQERSGGGAQAAGRSYAAQQRAQAQRQGAPPPARSYAAERRVRSTGEGGRGSPSGGKSYAARQRAERAGPPPQGVYPPPGRHPYPEQQQRPQRRQQGLGGAAPSGRPPGTPWVPRAGANPSGGFSPPQQAERRAVSAERWEGEQRAGALPPRSRSTEPENRRSSSLRNSNARDSQGGGQDRCV